MFIRVKTVHRRRYAYLVRGVRSGRVTRQKVVEYLGSVAKVSAQGVPPSVVARLRLDPEWVGAQISSIELTVEEGIEAARIRYNDLAKKGRVGVHVRLGSRPREPDELVALIRLSKKGFESLFRQISDLEYVMR